MTPDLTADLRKQVTAAEADLRARSERADLPWAVALRAEYDAAFAAGRTGLSWSEWRDGEIAQAAVAWVLATVFVRFCEDNDLVDRALDRRPRATGCGRRSTPRPRSTPPTRSRGTATGCGQAFGHLADLPADRRRPGPGALAGVVGAARRRHVPRRSSAFWRADRPPTAQLAARLHRPRPWTPGSSATSTRTSPSYAKKTYALLQTPVFVEEFILDRTLTPALAEFGLRRAAADRPDLRLRALPARRVRPAARPRGRRTRRALGRAASACSGPSTPCTAWTSTRSPWRSPGSGSSSPPCRRAACTPAGRRARTSTSTSPSGDSLLGGGRTRATLLDDSARREPARSHYATEDVDEHCAASSTPGRYHVVVGNPPYITVKDKALNEAYRAVYSTCQRQVRADGAVHGAVLRARRSAGRPTRPAGFVGQITSNSFMKREFGTKLIETLLSGADPRTRSTCSTSSTPPAPTSPATARRP